MDTSFWLGLYPSIPPSWIKVLDLLYNWNISGEIFEKKNYLFLYFLETINSENCALAESLTLISTPLTTTDAMCTTSDTITLTILDNSQLWPRSLTTCNHMFLPPDNINILYVHIYHYFLFIFQTCLKHIIMYTYLKDISVETFFLHVYMYYFLFI